MRKRWIVWIVVFIIAVFLIGVLNQPSKAYSDIPLGRFVSLLQSDTVRWVDIGHDELTGEFREPQSFGDQSIIRFRVLLPEGVSTDWAFSRWLLDNSRSADVGVGRTQDLLINILVPLIPWLLIFAFIWFFVFRQLRHQLKRSKDPVRVILVKDSAELSMATPITQDAN